MHKISQVEELETESVLFSNLQREHKYQKVKEDNQAIYPLTLPWKRESEANQH